MKHKLLIQLMAINASKDVEIWVCSFTNRGLSIGAKNVPDRVKFTRALLQRKDWSMWFCLPLCVWVPGLSPSFMETSPEKRSPRSAFAPGWEAEFA